MRRIIFTLIVAFFCSNVWAQCPTGDVTLSSQTEIDDFVSNFSTCDTIFGGLLIFGDGSFPGFDLSGLSFITTITGSLSLHQVSNLTGLESITYIGGDLGFIFSSVGGDIFDHEMYIGGDIIINVQLFPGSGNCAVQSFCDFVEMGGTINETYDYPYSFTPFCLIDIQNNCPGPSGCPTGDIEIFGQGAANNFGTSNPDCTVIEGDLIFRANPSAVDVTTGFANIERINGDLRVRSVEVVGAFTNLDTITGNIIVQDHYADSNDANLNASFPSLKYIGCNMAAFESEGSAGLTGSFPVLERVENQFYACGEHEAYINCGDCVNLEYIGGDVVGVVEGLDNVQTIIGSILPCSYSSQYSDCDTPPLPIETIDPLQVYLNDQTAILRWRTATETNNSGFEVQRSKDGIQWERISWQAGQGNTLTPHSYTYTDENPLFGTSYYRFKQVDFNGDFTYSNIVTLQYTRPGVTIFPNPNTGIFNIQSTTQGMYKILNTSGQVIQTGDLNNNISIDISNHPQGIYFVSVQINNDIITKRIIKM